MSSTPIAPFTSRRPISVSTRPGATTFTWMPLRRSSLASVHASASSAAFAMLYGAEFARHVRALAALEIITMSPRGRVRIDGSTSFEQRPRAERVRAPHPVDLGGVGVGDGLAARRDAGVVHEDVDRAEVARARASTIASHAS